MTVTYEAPHLSGRVFAELQNAHVWIEHFDPFTALERLEWNDDESTPTWIAGGMVQVEPRSDVHVTLSGYYCSPQAFYHIAERVPMHVAGKVILSAKATLRLLDGVHVYANARNALNRPAREGPETDRIFATYLLGLEIEASDAGR